MNDLCTDIGWWSINKSGEQLCGDRIDVVEMDENSTVIVLSDGLGSGVKANILSTLTSKIISTMAARGISMEDCVATVAATLPVCSVRGVAYSTFTAMRILNSEKAEIFQYDNPRVILLRDGENFEMPVTEINIDGKLIYRSEISLKEKDVFVAISDGTIHAGAGKTLNYQWDRKDIIAYLQTLCHVDFTAKTLATILLNECKKLYNNKPSDDASACVVRIRKRQALNVVVGPPANRDDCEKMMSLFFSKAGKHIVCGGTTAMIAANFLGKNVTPHNDYNDVGIPPTSHIEGVELVTEGMITLNRVLDYAQDHLAHSGLHEQWGHQKDAASKIARLLFEEATDINFYVGTAVNPAHQNLDLPIQFNIKMNLIDELSECLKKMGKRIKVSFF